MAVVLQPSGDEPKPNPAKKARLLSSAHTKSRVESPLELVFTAGGGEEDEDADAESAAAAAVAAAAAGTGVGGVGGSSPSPSPPPQRVAQRESAGAGAGRKPTARITPRAAMLRAAAAARSGKGGAARRVGGRKVPPRRKFVADELNELAKVFKEMEASLMAMKLQRRGASRFELGAVGMVSISLSVARFTKIVALVPDMYGSIVRGETTKSNVSGISFALAGPSAGPVRRAKFEAVLMQLDKAVALGGRDVYPGGVASMIEARVDALPHAVKSVLRVGAAPASQKNSLSLATTPQSPFSVHSRVASRIGGGSRSVAAASGKASKEAARSTSAVTGEASLAARIAAREKANLQAAQAATKESMFSIRRLRQCAQFLVVKFAAKSALPLRGIVDAGIFTFRNQYAVRYETSSFARLLNELTTALPPGALSVESVSGIRYLRVDDKSALRAFGRL
ncbi:uncharacterized protein AMSG_11680 [Thecamonas trahens ATCC 50062]|uniref:Uncharacterized protein n=1 Tax=Thecamonas trahens ATCC 50062 TaxID=461836 RepID=A0A0L0DW11_THETB|nr:hypothetical protein AMSG_11680 [Thecamonas trahens ATCC 50062]KNC55703.1 hypothetical protein AMSG_11680 [Thecamonas trahens ATCC 50062]|eukprot:XP_013761486.1 hypothetical protein AMSG_11680 [Thecamonas trahens ATCC 50062]